MPELRKRKRMKHLADLVGGPMDGEQLERYAPLSDITFSVRPNALARYEWRGEVVNNRRQLEYVKPTTVRAPHDSEGSM